MSKSIIFIPRSHFLDSDRVMPHLGPLYLKSFLESKGHEVDLNDKPDLSDLPNLENFDAIGISTTTPQYYEANGGKELAKRIKERYPDKKLIIGGSHANNYHNELTEEGIFNHIIRGDGEKAFLDILEKKDLPLIISYPQLSEEEMNSFPAPWRSNEFLSDYKYSLFGKTATTMLTSRYCAMKCKFCEERDTQLRLYRPERAEEELETIKKFGFDGLMFYDDILPITEKRTTSLCDIIRNFDMVFRCNGHAKILSRNKKVLETLAGSGCREICLGVESGDQMILDTIAKGNKVEEVFEATKNVLDSGMKLSSYLMIGLPGESRESITNTIKYIDRFANNPNFTFDLTIFYPYRYTYIREHLDEFDLKLHLDGNFIGAYKKAEGASECCVSTSSLTQKDIVAERNKILERYRSNFRGNIPLNK